MATLVSEMKKTADNDFGQRDEDDGQQQPWLWST
jgi:hypothetical protein